VAADTGLDISSLVAIRFIFPVDTAASVWLDDLRISREGL